jgi:Gas vesicle synthesis protein GvpL/GvpF
MTRSNNAAKYVYGVVRASPKGRLSSKGINGQPIRIISAKGLGALTSDVSGDPVEAGRDELLTHSRVLESALERGTVLPMRFGVVMPSEASVREELLAVHREELAAQLDEMNGKVEVNIKGLYDEPAVLRELVQENGEIAGLREALRDQPEDATYYERIRLGELVAAALDARRSADEHQIVDRLAEHALGVELGGAMHERMAVNASFLLERERTEEFDRALDQIASEQGGRIRFRYTGPLPPHSFVELSMEA